jgi:hypothetical protein
MSTPVETYVTRIPQGEGWRRPLRLHVKGTPISLVGATIEFYVGSSAVAVEAVEGGAAVPEIDFVDAVDGRFALELTGEQTGALAPGRYVLEVWTVLAGAQPKQWIAGIMEIQRTVRPTS